MKLEVGTVLYTNALEKVTITRVTEKQAMVRFSDSYEMKFDREPRDPKWFHSKGSSGYMRVTYSVETPELKEQYRIKGMRNKIKNVDAEKLTVKQLEEIITILGGLKC
jgi:hypothetical protein